MGSPVRGAVSEQLAEIQRRLSAGRRQEADALADRVESVVTRCFDVAVGVSAGNPYTNANTLLDHVLAYGPDAARQPPPRLHGGPCLPAELIEPVMAALREQQWLPERGYLDEP